MDINSNRWFYSDDFMGKGKSELIASDEEVYLL